MAWRNIIVPIIVFLISINSVFGDDRRDYRLVSANQAPKIDGLLQDSIWSSCSVASHFIQTIPEPDQESRYASEVRICYTRSALYISAVLFQPATDGSRQFTARDMLNNSFADVFGIFLDTYDDHQNGFVFKVSSAGVQQDERLSQGAEYGDIGWDAVWNSAVGTMPDRWQVEMEIPFSALRFTVNEQMKWGVNLYRIVRKKNETSFWNRVDIQKQGFLAQTGCMKGFDPGMKPPVRLFLFPYLSTGMVKQEQQGNEEVRFLRSGGMDVKYGINESFTLDLTLIPDFSQVISDNLIRNLSPFEQQLNENRPFFTEGTELFNKAGLFYTRRVGGTPVDYYRVRSEFGNPNEYRILRNPNVTRLYNAFKVSGRNNRKLGIGIFNAVAAPVFAEIEQLNTGEKFKVNTEPLTNYHVLVLDQALKGQSNLNFTQTHVWREGSARDASVSSMNWTQFLKQEEYMVNVYGQLSMINEQQWNYGSSAGWNISKISGKLVFDAGFDFQSKGFNKRDLGIQFDYNNMSQYLSIRWQQNKTRQPWLQLYRMGLNQNWSQNAAPFVFKSYQSEAFLFLLFKNFWDVRISTETKPFRPVDFYQLGAFGQRLKTYPYWYNSISGSSDSRKRLFWMFGTGYGISNEARSDYLYVNQGFRYRFSPKFDLQINGEASRDHSNIGYAYWDDNSGLPVAARRDVYEYTGEISVKINLNANTNFTGRFRHYTTFIYNRSFHQVDDVGEWRYQKLNYQPGLDENFNLQNIDVFFNWIFKPGSRLVLSYKQWLNNPMALNERIGNNYFDNVWQLASGSHAYELALRVIYFLDYNRIRPH